MGERFLRHPLGRRVVSETSGPRPACLRYLLTFFPLLGTMETNALMGMNVARLIVDKWSEELRGVGYENMLEKEMEAMESGEM